MSEPASTHPYWPALAAFGIGAAFDAMVIKFLLTAGKSIDKGWGWGLLSGSILALALIPGSKERGNRFVNFEFNTKK